MNINAAERKVLRFLVAEYTEDFGYYDFAWIRQHVRLRRDVIRRACRSLARKGLTQYARGLSTDDGDFRGAGYSATKAGVDFIEPKFSSPSPTAAECRSVG